MNKYEFKDISGKEINLENLLTDNNDKVLLNQYFLDRTSWADAVLEHINIDTKLQKIINFNLETVLDIGAHIGIVSLFMLPFCKRIFAIEPIPINFYLLAKLTKNHNNIITTKCAISDKNGFQEFFCNYINFTQSSLIKHGEVQSIGNVECFDLETFLNKNKIQEVDFVKMNIEGCEIPIIIGDKFKKSRNRIKSLLISVHNINDGEYKNSWEDNCKILLNRLNDLKYKTQIISDCIYAC